MARQTTKGSTTVDAEVDVVRNGGDQPELRFEENREFQDEQQIVVARSVALQLMRIFNSGQPPVEVRGTGHLLELVRNLDLTQAVQEMNLPKEIADWWNQNRQNLSYVLQPEAPAPILLTAQERADAQIFQVLFQVLQQRGLPDVLRDLGVDLNLILQSPPTFQRLIWDVFVELVGDKIRSRVLMVQSAGFSPFTENS